MSASTSAAAASPKGAHYNTSLTAALLRGAWAESNPGQAPNKTELSWGELVRKWGKHTGGNTALIHHLRDISLLYLSSTSHSTTSSSGYITVSASSQPQSSLTEPPGSSNSSNDSANTTGTGQSGSHSSFVHIPHPHLRHRKKASLDIPDNSSSTIAGSGSSTIRGDTASISKASYLSAGDLDGDESDDSREWSEGNLWWNGVGSESIDEVREGIKGLENLISSNKLSTTELTSAKLTLAYHFHALGSHEDALRIYQVIDWNAENRLGVVQGDAAVLERIRGRCLQGLSYELAQNPDYSQAIQSYLLTIPLIQSLSQHNLPLPAYLTSPSSAPKSPFDPQREIYRWISTALTRSSVLSARKSQQNQQDSHLTLRILRTYHAFNSSWPATFRPIQRQRMLLLYLRALKFTYPSSRQPPPEPRLLYSAPSNLSARALWSKEVIEAIHNGRALLQTTTSFPRAGSINRPVTDFTEICVALYSKSAELGREVISVLWWAMTLTFQSQTILRHLTHLLSDIGDSNDARRAFELYVQLVLKAKQTQQPEISLQLKRRPTNEDAASPAEIRRQTDNADLDDLEKKAQFAESEIDSDKQFIETLLGGTRLLSRDLGETEEAWRYAALAGDVLSSSGGVGIGNDLRAGIEEAKGIIRMGMAVYTADAVDRPTYQAQAINHLTAAIDLFPSSSGYYHLAHCQAEARSIDAATQSIRSSLELDSTNVQAWHLLALLLTARRDWEGALKACEAGISVWEQDEEEAAQDEDFSLSSNDSSNEVESKDFAIRPPTPTTTNTNANTSTLDNQHQHQQQQPLILKDGSFPHLSISPPRTTTLSRSVKLEHVIRLRMTLNVIIEKTQGPEIAMYKQQELFAFFSARSGKNRKKLGYHSGFGKSSGLKSVTSSGSLSALNTGTETTINDNQTINDLGGSFVNLGFNDAATVSVQPPTPMDEKPIINPISLASPITEKPPITVQSPSPSPTPSTLPSGGGGAEDEKPRRSLSIKSQKITKHLHVPGHQSSQTTSAPVSRPSSIRRPSNTQPALIPQQQQVHGRERSQSATQSLAPTAIHSHFRNSRSPKNSAPPPPPPITQQGDDHGRTLAESRILSNLWLMSAATFRRWNKIEQCLVAIEEAEVLDPENSDVWVQLGMYYNYLNDQQQQQQQQHQNENDNDQTTGVRNLSLLEESESSYIKSLLLKPENSNAIIGLSKIYLTQSELNKKQKTKMDLAENLLNSLTSEKGWDSIQAWFLLGKISSKQNRLQRSRECFEFALNLEINNPIRDWNQVSRWL
ncbi:uncharacterized protein L201_000781 [Kwoniella dendrophila CBS 6074]|uniref:TPR-like protein n=1 Tax=Kwoniella dendrophila CBS 6074 TaxID=1295534 RepID=A0AAX4JLR5_9TREE